jgi:hypothetical protein
MSTQHTPGPWKALRANENWDGPAWELHSNAEPSPFTKIEAEESDVVICSDAFEIKPEDAQLMAAAPDLLGALIQMLDAYEIPSVRKQARAAIAKAIGGQP